MQALENSELSLGHVTELLMKINNERDETISQIRLTEDMLAEGNLEPEFICTICMNVLKNPRQCKECEGFVDNDCLEHWWKSSASYNENHRNQCPLCKKRNGFTNMHRMVMNWLNNKLFKCKLCDATFKYEKFDDHYNKECPKTKSNYRCELCKDLSFESETALKKHWQESCNFIERRCKKCEISFTLE